MTKKIIFNKNKTTEPNWITTPKIKKKKNACWQLKENVLWLDKLYTKKVFMSKENEEWLATGKMYGRFLLEGAPSYIFFFSFLMMAFRFFISPFILIFWMVLTNLLYYIDLIILVFHVIKIILPVYNYPCYF